MNTSFQSIILLYTRRQSLRFVKISHSTNRHQSRKSSQGIGRKDRSLRVRGDLPNMPEGQALGSAHPARNPSQGLLSGYTGTCGLREPRLQPVGPMSPVDISVFCQKWESLFTFSMLSPLFCLPSTCTHTDIGEPLLGDPSH